MNILVIEDDRKAASLLARGLHEEGFAVDVAHSAEMGQRLMQSADYDLLVLDWLLPGKEGIALCREVRQGGVQMPILMLTARDGLNDRIAGLDTGADDYLTKPFAFNELLARVRALLRRSRAMSSGLLTVGELSLEPYSQRVARAGQAVELTRKEYAILELLMRHAGQVVTRARLAKQVWEAESVEFDNLIDAHISNLRKKLDLPEQQSLIRTVRGRGFMMQSEERLFA